MTPILFDRDRKREHPQPEPAATTKDTSHLDAAWSLAESLTTVWPVEADDVRHARRLIDRHPTLDSRDLLHLASCQRRGVKQIKTYDRALAAQIGP